MSKISFSTHLLNRFSTSFVCEDALLTLADTPNKCADKDSEPSTRHIANASDAYHEQYGILNQLIHGYVHLNHV